MHASLNVIVAVTPASSTRQGFLQLNQKFRDPPSPGLLSRSRCEDIVSIDGAAANILPVDDRIVVRRGLSEVILVPIIAAAAPFPVRHIRRRVSLVLVMIILESNLPQNRLVPGIIPDVTQREQIILFRNQAHGECIVPIVAGLLFNEHALPVGSNQLEDVEWPHPRMFELTPI